MFSIRKFILTKSYRKTSVISFIRNSSVNAANILTSPWEPIDIPKVSINEVIFDTCTKWPDYIAMECAVTQRRYTYADVLKTTQNLDRNLRKRLKLKKGDVLAVYLPNLPEFALIVLAALRAGILVTTLNPLYTADEISRQLKDSSANAIITIVELYNVAKKSVSLIGTQVPILAIKTQDDMALPQGAVDFFEFLQKTDYPDLPVPSHDDLALMPYSSGTIGLPKGVKLNHYNIVANILQCAKANITKETTNDFQEVLPGVLPQYHIYGLTVCTLMALAFGNKIVTMPLFKPELYVETVKKYKATVLFVAPPIVLFLASHPLVKKEHLESVRTVMSGAAPLGALDEERFLNKAGRHVEIIQGYGLTETSPVVAIMHNDLKTERYTGGSIGRGIANTLLKIIDPNDPDEKPLGPNETGELLVKGPQVMQGYHKRPVETTESFTKDGWFRTGDLMYYNEDGLLFVKDRLKELIKVKGFQVPPAELEEVIRSHPDVRDAAVIGISDPKMGEAPRAYVVPNPGKKINVEELNEFVAEKVAPYKQLKGGIEIVESIPKNASGKIMRRILKEQYEKQTKRF